MDSLALVWRAKRPFTAHTLRERKNQQGQAAQLSPQQHFRRGAAGLLLCAAAVASYCCC